MAESWAVPVKLTGFAPIRWVSVSELLELAEQGALSSYWVARLLSEITLDEEAG